MIFYDYKIKEIKQRYEDSMQKIIKSNSLDNTWRHKLQEELDNTNAELSDYFDLAKVEIEQTLNTTTSMHLRPNSLIFKATAIIDNDTIRNTYYIDREGKNVSHSMADVKQQAKSIENSKDEWARIASNTNNNLNYLK